MEELSGFTVVIPRDLIMELEIEAALDTFGRRRRVPYVSISVIGRGVLRAYGKVGGLLIKDGQSGEDVTDTFRVTWPDGTAGFDQLLGDMEREFDRALLRGPRDDAEETRLRGLGWDPRVARRMAEDNAAGERAQAERLTADPQWRQQRVRDVVSVRHLALELRQQLEKGARRTRT